MKNVFTIRAMVELCLGLTGVVASAICTATMQTVQDGHRAELILTVSVVLMLMAVFSLYQDYYVNVERDGEGGML